MSTRRRGAVARRSVSGALGGTTIAARFAPRADGKLAGALDLTAPEGFVLLGQLGAPVLLTQKLGPAHVSARAQPNGEGTLDLTAAGDVAGLRGAFEGRSSANDFDGDLSLAGDAGNIWQSLGGALRAALPVSAAAHVSGGAGRVNAQNLSGSWDDVGFSGALAFGADGFGGALTCDRISAPALVALVLGPPAPVKAGALWSSLSFAPVVFDPPRGKWSIETAHLEPFGGKARFDLALGPGSLGVSGATAQAAGGVLHGGFDLRREGGQVTLAGDVEGKDLTIGNPAFSATAHFAGNGASAAALVASMAGAGTARARDLSVAGASAAGPDAALAANAADDAPFDAARVARTLDEAFARKPWRAVNAVATRELEREQARVEHLKTQDRERLRALRTQ